ncbi:MAG: hypothetical protein R3C10_19910 [Pirellulales bacterium]
MVFEEIDEFALNNMGQVAFRATDSNGEGIWSDRFGVLDVEAHVGAGATWNGGEAAYYAFLGPALSDTSIALIAGVETVTGEYFGYWRGADATLDLVYASNTPAPGLDGHALGGSGVRTPLLLSDGGHLAFNGTERTTADDEPHRNGVWSTGSGGLDYVVIEGVAASGTNNGQEHATFQFNRSIRPAMNNLGEVTFLSQLTGPGIDSSNDSGIWSQRDDNLELVARRRHCARDRDRRYVQRFFRFSGFQRCSTSSFLCRPDWNRC